MRIHYWGATGVEFDDLDKLNRELAEIFESSPLQLDHEGRPNEQVKRTLRLRQGKDTEHIAEALARHLTRGEIVFTCVNERGRRWGWRVHPKSINYLECKLIFKFQDDVVLVDDGARKETAVHVGKKRRYCFEAPPINPPTFSGLSMSDYERFYWIQPAYIDRPTTVWALERKALAALSEGGSEQELWRVISPDEVPELYNLGTMLATFDDL